MMVVVMVLGLTVVFKFKLVNHSWVLSLLRVKTIVRPLVGCRWLFSIVPCCAPHSSLFGAKEIFTFSKHESFPGICVDLLRYQDGVRDTTHASFVIIASRTLACSLSSLPVSRFVLACFGFVRPFS